jgi:hypothetical protein
MRGCSRSSPGSWRFADEALLLLPRGWGWHGRLACRHGESSAKGRRTGKRCHSGQILGHGRGWCGCESLFGLVVYCRRLGHHGIGGVARRCRHRRRCRISFDPVVGNYGRHLRSQVCFHGVGKMSGRIQPHHVDVVIKLVLELFHSIARQVFAHRVAHALGYRSLGVLGGIAGGAFSGPRKEYSLGTAKCRGGLTLVPLCGMDSSRRFLGLAPTTRRGRGHI